MPENMNDGLGFIESATDEDETLAEGEVWVLDPETFTKRKVKVNYPEQSRDVNFSKEGWNEFLGEVRSAEEKLGDVFPKMADIQKACEEGVAIPNPLGLEPPRDEGKEFMRGILDVMEEIDEEVVEISKSEHDRFQFDALHLEAAREKIATLTKSLTIWKWASGVFGVIALALWLF